MITGKKIKTQPAKLNTKDAPKGYVAVEIVGSPPDGRSWCGECKCRGALCTGAAEKHCCNAKFRKDGRDVYFEWTEPVRILKRVHEIEIEKLKCDHRDELTRQQADLYKRVLSSLEWMKA